MSGEVPENLKYTETHEWIEVKGNTARVGITDHAQSELTDIVFVELPEVGKEVKQGDEICVVESVKSVSEIYAPLSGKITAVNKELEDTPEKINQSPYDEGWLVEMELTNPEEVEKLLSAEDYKKITA
ncbi:MAG TPA: glycine cleavage system protein GcvH [Thermoplasmatales archaeon]|nr:glycine cleavage system protein GcvH [Thermoplasmatales archaeon]